MICVTNRGKKIQDLSIIFDEYIYWGIVLLNGTTLLTQICHNGSKNRLQTRHTVDYGGFCSQVRRSPCLCGTFPKFGDLLSHRDKRKQLYYLSHHKQPASPSNTIYQHIKRQGCNIKSKLAEIRLAINVRKCYEISVNNCPFRMKTSGYTNQQ